MTDKFDGDVQGLFDRYIIKRRIAFYDRAVRLGIIDYGQRCALVQMVVLQVVAQRQEEAAWEAAGCPEVWPPE